MKPIPSEPVTVRIDDGTSCNITFFGSQGDSAQSVILCAPALGVAAHSYRTVAEKLVRTGCVVVTADLRGIGESSVRASRETDFGYHETIAFDWPAIIATVRCRHPHGPLYLLGHSLGGQLGALFASVHPGELDGLILVASCSVYYSGWGFPVGLGVLAGTQLAALTAQLLGYFPGRQLGFGGAEARRLMRDWARNARSGRYTVENSPHDFEDMMARATLPVLSISIEGDTFAPERACKNLVNKLKAASVTTRRVAVTGESGRAHHFNWLRSPGVIVGEIDDWLSTLDSGDQRR
jgi:predicted alpha/beta hydrolase